MTAKDNIDVAGMPSTSGFLAFQSLIPRLDADVVRNVKNAGAILIAKANMSPGSDKEAWGHSETGGLARNPFGLDYTTYGSSGGTGAAGAAMLGIVGLGAETGVSINYPSSAANLVGLRVPVGQLSTNGALPNSALQDVIGPIAKRVEDVATTLDAMLQQPAAYSNPTVIRPDGLSQMRINIFNQFAYGEFDVPGRGHYAVDPKVKSLFDGFVRNLQMSGAVVRNDTSDPTVTTPIVFKLQSIDTSACTPRYRDAYLSDPSRFGPEVPYHSYADVLNSKKLPPFYQSNWEKGDFAYRQGKCDNQTADFLAARRDFTSKFLDVLVGDADLVLWPAAPGFPQKLPQAAFMRDWADETQPQYINLVMAGALGGYPAMTIPLGFSDPQPGAPDGLPVGVYMLTKPALMSRLFTAAYAYQERFGGSKMPRLFAEPQNVGVNTAGISFPIGGNTAVNSCPSCLVCILCVYRAGGCNSCQPCRFF